jgi:choline-sulfatase
MWGFTHPEECEGKESAGTSPVPIGPYTYHLHGRGLLERFHEDYRNRRGSIEDQYRDSVLPADAFEDAYIGRQATKWLEWVPDDFPWHLFVSFVGPHSPYDPPEAYADRYREVGMPDAIPSAPEGKPEWVKRKMRTIGPEEVSISRRQYCGAIEVIDDQVGAILKAIESRGMLDNTIVVFSSDHGDMLGDHGLYGKSVPYEASVRVPLTMAGPGIEGGRVSDALVELIDVNPTLCELAGLQPQAGIDGRSICPLLRGEARAHRTDTVSAIRNFRCIRTDRHKLVLNDNDLTELYDLHENPDELSNIAEAEPEVVRELTGRLVDRYTEGRWQH